MSSTSSASSSRRPFFERFNALVDHGWMGRLSPTELRVYLSYLRYMGGSDCCAYPCNGRLAKDAGQQSLAHVRSARASLVKKGFLTLIHAGSNQPGDRNIFRVNVPPIAVDVSAAEGADPARNPGTCPDSGHLPENGSHPCPDSVLSPAPIPGTEGAQGRGTRKGRDAAGDDPEGFNRFWDVWPKHHRKVNRAGCRRHWTSANLESLADRITASVEGSKLSHDWQKQDGQFIPMPLTWLRQRRWESEPAPPHVANAAGESLPFTPESFQRASYTPEIAALIGDPTPAEVA